MATVLAFVRQNTSWSKSLPFILAYVDIGLSKIKQKMTNSILYINYSNVYLDVEIVSNKNPMLLSVYMQNQINIIAKCGTGEHLSVLEKLWECVCLPYLK